MQTFWDSVRVIAHRCGGALAPENSLGGLDAAVRCGLRAVEFDVMLSADEVPVLIHDETLQRTTGVSGRVCEMAGADLLQMTCAHGWAAAWSKERIPSLAETLARCQALGLVPNIEIKPATGFEARTGEVVASMALAFWSRQDVVPLFSSFSSVALDRARSVVPSWPRAWLVEQVNEQTLGDMKNLGASALHCDWNQGAWSWLDALQEDGVPVRCYTVNTAEGATELMARGVTAVFSDRVDLLRHLEQAQSR